MTHAKTVAVLWGTEGQPFSIGYGPPMWADDSGLTILLDDSPDPDDVEPDDPRITLVCVDCVLDDFPGIAVGLKLAREYGVADLDDDGVWVVGDLARLNPD